MSGFTVGGFGTFVSLALFADDTPEVRFGGHPCLLRSCEGQPAPSGRAERLVEGEGFTCVRATPHTHYILERENCRKKFKQRVRGVVRWCSRKCTAIFGDFFLFVEQSGLVVHCVLGAPGVRACVTLPSF